LAYYWTERIAAVGTGRRPGIDKPTDATGGVDANEPAHFAAEAQARLERLDAPLDWRTVPKLIEVIGPGLHHLDTRTPLA
jgi:hypothetical protein